MCCWKWSFFYKPTENKDISKHLHKFRNDKNISEVLSPVSEWSEVSRIDNLPSVESSSDNSSIELDTRELQFSDSESTTSSGEVNSIEENQVKAISDIKNT